MISQIIVAAAGLLLSVVFFILAKTKVISKKVMIIAVAGTLLLAIGGLVFLRLNITPELKLTGKNDVTLKVFSEYEEQGATALLGRKDISDSIVIDGNVDTSKIGDYTVTYKVEHNNKNYEILRKIKVIDDVAPEITLKGEPQVTASAILLYKDSGVTVKDNYDGDITAKTEIKQNKISEEKYEIVYSVSDSSGNAASAKRIVDIKDIVPPVVTIKGAKRINLLKGSKYTDSGATAKDDLDGDVTKSLEVTGEVNTEKVGIYTITYTATDKAGNKNKAERKVTIYEKKETPVTPPKPQEDKPATPEVKPDGKSVICLTFDDGPSANVTPRILDILKKNNVKATFFIVNYTNQTLPLIKRMVNEGHTIGIHGYSHDWSIYDSEDKFMDNIYKLRDKLYKDTGYMSTTMRFPGGSSNTVSRKHSSGIMTRLAARVQKEGWKYYDWNVDSGDANGKTIPKNTLINNFKKGVKKGRTNVVLCHDIGSKTTTADALQAFIDYGKQNGYTFSAINDSTPGCHHGINN